MKTKIYLLAFTLSALVFVQRTEAQGVLYKDMVFSSVDFTSDVVYSTSNSTTLAMDIYQPHGDTSSMRPVLIMAHGGSFISGDRTNDNVCTQLCDSFARRGYVCASIDYRLGNALQMIDSAQAITVVMKAISDGKSAVRFFRKDAATTNTYRINPDLIFVGGNSAGAVLYMHQIYIDSLNECPPNLRNIINANGGLEGNSGNDGYCSYSTAVLNLAGGLNVPEFVGPGNKPSFNAQGDQDATVPYNCADAQSGFTPVRLCGLGAIEPLYNQYSINHQSIVYPGAGHVPWQSDNAELWQIDTSAANFFYSLIMSGATAQCPSIETGINDVREAVGVSIFPNPASSQVQIQASKMITTITVYDATGRVVNMVSNVNNHTYEMNTSNLSKGVYMFKFEGSAEYAPTVKQVVIE